MGKGIQKPRTTYAFEYNEDIVPACPAVAMTLRKPKSLCYDFHTRSTKALKAQIQYMVRVSLAPPAM